MFKDTFIAEQLRATASIKGVFAMSPLFFCQLSFRQFQIESQIYVCVNFGGFCYSITKNFCALNCITKCMNFRSSHLRCSVRKGVLRNFAKFIGKHLCQSLFFNKVAALTPATFSYKILFYRTPLDDCFWNLLLLIEF